VFNLSQDTLQSFADNGFVIIRSFFNPEKLSETKTAMDRYITEVVPSLPDSDAFYIDKNDASTLKQLQRIAENDPYFERYANDADTLSVCKQLLGEDVHTRGVEWFCKPSGSTHPTPPHQDNFYFCLSPPSVVTVWIALDVVDTTNGCLHYVPGSHKHGIRDHGATSIVGFSQGIVDFGDKEMAMETPVHLEPGDCVIHHGNTIHRADPNPSDRTRRGFALVIEGASAQRDDDAFSRYVDSVQAQHESLGLDVDQSIYK
tara:strand:+ start:2586 stop:3362 length:777 start_codon:yes stop_codon:yes gene_type:complete